MKAGTLRNDDDVARVVADERVREGAALLLGPRRDADVVDVDEAFPLAQHVERRRVVRDELEVRSLLVLAEAPHQALLGAVRQGVQEGQPIILLEEAVEDLHAVDAAVRRVRDVDEVAFFGVDGRVLADDYRAEDAAHGHVRDLADDRGVALLRGAAGEADAERRRVGVRARGRVHLGAVVREGRDDLGRRDGGPGHVHELPPFFREERREVRLLC